MGPSSCGIPRVVAISRLCHGVRAGIVFLPCRSWARRCWLGVWMGGSGLMILGWDVWMWTLLGVSRVDGDYGCLLMWTDPVTSVAVAKANDSYLVSTLDSTIRLMDKRDGKLLQAFRDPDVRCCTTMETLQLLILHSSKTRTTGSVPLSQQQTRSLSPAVRMAAYWCGMCFREQSSTDCDTLKRH